MLVLGGVSHDKPNSARCRLVEYARRIRVLFRILVIDVSLVRSRWLFFFTSLGVVMGEVLSFQRFATLSPSKWNLKMMLESLNKH